MLICLTVVCLLFLWFILFVGIDCLWFWLYALCCGFAFVVFVVFVGCLVGFVVVCYVACLLLWFVWLFAGLFASVCY